MKVLYIPVLFLFFVLSRQPPSPRWTHSVQLIAYAPHSSVYTSERTGGFKETRAEGSAKSNSRHCSCGFAAERSGTGQVQPLLCGLFSVAVTLTSAQKAAGARWTQVSCFVVQGIASCVWVFPGQKRTTCLSLSFPVLPGRYATWRHLGGRWGKKAMYVQVHRRGIRRKRHISTLNSKERKKTVSEIWVYLMLQRTRVQRFSTFRLVHSISIVIYSIRLGFSFGM